MFETKTFRSVTCSLISGNFVINKIAKAKTPTASYKIQSYLLK